jgi:hypothetical protein
VDLLIKASCWEKDESSPSADALNIWAVLGLMCFMWLLVERGHYLSTAYPKNVTGKAELIDAFDNMTPSNGGRFLRSAKDSHNRNQANSQAKNESLGKVMWLALLIIETVEMFLIREIENEDSGLVVLAVGVFG